MVSRNSTCLTRDGEKHRDVRSFILHISKCNLMCLRQRPYRDKYSLGTDNNCLNWRLPIGYLDILPFPSVIYISLYIYMYIYIYVWQISMNLQRAQFVIRSRSNDNRLHERV